MPKITTNFYFGELNEAMSDIKQTLNELEKDPEAKIRLMNRLETLRYDMENEIDNYSQSAQDEMAEFVETTQGEFEMLKSLLRDYFRFRAENSPLADLFESEIRDRIRF